MSLTCDEYTCNTGNKGTINVRNNRVYGHTHDWGLKFNITDAINVVDVTRKFNIKTTYNNTTTSVNKLITTSNGVSACDQKDSGTLTGEISESIYGSVGAILYADIPNHVYLLKKTVENHTFTSDQQNPFVYFSLYCTVRSIAYFLQATKSKNYVYELWVHDKLVWSHNTELITTKYEPLPIVWPQPGSSSMFFNGAPEYAWMNDTWFYWYNNPSDVGFAPCNEKGYISGLGEGTLTGYSIALADGGKDFFYPNWIRENFLVNSWIHNLWKLEAERRFYNVLGGKISKTCAAAFEEDFNLYPEISNEIYGNFIRIGDLDFWSFHLNEIEQVINNLGNADITKSFNDAFAGTKDDLIYYPIGVI